MGNPIRPVCLFSAQALTTSYVQSGTFDAENFPHGVIIHLKASGYAAYYSTLAWIDPSQVETLYSAQSLAAGATAKVVITDPWPYFAVSVKSQSTGNAGTITVFVNAK